MAEDENDTSEEFSTFFPPTRVRAQFITVINAMFATIIYREIIDEFIDENDLSNDSLNEEDLRNKSYTTGPDLISPSKLNK